MDFLKKKRDFVDLIIKHIGTSANMDLLLRLLTCIEPPQPRQDVLNVSRDLNCWGCCMLATGLLCAGGILQNERARRWLSQHKDSDFNFILFL